MENYNQLGEEAAAAQRGATSSFLYCGSVLAPPSYRAAGAGAGEFHLQAYEPIVKTEGGSSSHNHHQRFESEMEAIKAKIIAHPQYSNLLEAYMDCQKVGAPPEVVARLAAVRQEFESRQRAAGLGGRDISSKDPELDQFMEAYYDMLVKYREELTRPLQEAMEFMRRIESQLNMLSNAPVRVFTSAVSFCIYCSFVFLLVILRGSFFLECFKLYMAMVSVILILIEVEDNEMPLLNISSVRRIPTDEPAKDTRLD